MMNNAITLAHGNGGRLMHELIDRIHSFFKNPILDEMTDAGEFRLSSTRYAFSTDSYVVKPLFFPGSDIGRLAVYGTVNDLAMKAALPRYLSCGFIIEEGFPIPTFDRVVQSMATAAKNARIAIITGDIKVVEKRSADQLFINTAGIGTIQTSHHITAQARPGDTIVINGHIAEHGLAVLSEREKLDFGHTIKSDCQNLAPIVFKCLKQSTRIHVLRDLTRGGLATALNEIARSSNLGIEIDETKVPIKKPVQKLCDILGFDPLYIANEGKFICFVHPQDAAKIKKAMGKTGAIIGRTTTSHRREVFGTTRLGSTRLIPMLEVDQLPRIC
ncbi:MAG: hydrogenase expression/formation protein HypE [Elusimicrobia bacterium]|nr:hydrogenase expression/formation protein HypE [Elusimicrobiota bacterium]MBD3411578.1 hydrogenase expression/formation protein HypE [Elusimicrobiota bacterium]